MKKAKKVQKQEQKKARTGRAWVESGTIIRHYKGVDHTVQVTAEEGKVKIVLYDGETFKSLTAVAQQITGYKAISGPAFFKVGKEAATV